MAMWKVNSYKEHEKRHWYHPPSSLNFTTSCHIKTYPLNSLIFFSFFIFSYSRPFSSSKGPNYSSAEVERDFTPLELFFPMRMLFFFRFMRRRFSWKKDKSQLVSLVMATPAWGRELGFSPWAGSLSPTHACLQSCEVLRNDVQQGDACSGECWDDESGFVRQV